jgi:hypothetical protein
MPSRWKLVAQGVSRGVLAGAQGTPLEIVGESTKHGTPNKPMQRAETHKVHGRGRSMFSQSQVRLARVLNRQRAVADGCRWPTLHD